MDVAVAPPPRAPVTATPLIGRAAELAAVGRWVTDPEARLITLTGPPGVGKTRLALAVAAQQQDAFADGVVFVDLTAVRAPDLVPGEIAAALAGPRGARGGLAPLVGDRQLLLVLDNFEQVLPAGPPLADLLAACPRLTLLVTSRERLHLTAERELPVPPLALPGPAETADPARLAAVASVAVLVQRVHAFAPDFAVTPGNGPALAEICVRLDGLPLALELAAPRLRLFTPAELTFRLRARLGALANDARDVPARHRTLHSALTWSHDLLGPDERAMFRQLSVFAGGWTLEAAQQVCTVEDAVATTASLADKSLLRRTAPVADGPPGAGARFTMLESLREFAAELLDRAGGTAAARERHAGYFAGLAARIEARVGTADERAAIEEAGAEVANLRAALASCRESGRTALVLPLACALGWYAYTRGRLGEGQAALDAALADAAGTADPPADALAGTLVMAGVFALAQGDVDRAEALIRRGLRVNEDVGSLRRTAIGAAFLGHLARVRGRPDDAVAHHLQAGRLHAELGNAPGVAWSRYDLGLLARHRGDDDGAAGCLRDALRVFRDQRYDWAVGCSAWALATVELRRGRAPVAAGLLAEALGAFAAGDDSRGTAQCLEGAAAVAAARGEHRAAARLLGAADALRDRLTAPLPGEERGARDALVRGVAGALGPDAADDARRAGREQPTAAAVAAAGEVLAGTAPAGRLTRREHEVAVLVRGGRTNRQIGRQLGISEKTTEVHVHNIIRKLGARSRSEVAAWVAARNSGADG